MRRVLPLVVLALVCCLGGGVLAAVPEPSGAFHHSSDPVKTETRAIIEGQLAAFRADDYPKAYTFAAAEIKTMFPVEDFEQMVRSQYAVIAKSTATEFGVAFDTGEEAVVNVRIENAEKKSVEYQYLLKKEAGGWKISGVSEVKAEGLSV